MVFLEEGRRFLDMTSAVYIMPLLLSCLGAVFTRAGVGDAFSVLFGKIIPSGNVYIGIVAYALGMMLFTIIMGNAFAAITVMTVGVGVPGVYLEVKDKYSIIKMQAIPSACMLVFQLAYMFIAVNF